MSPTASTAPLSRRAVLRLGAAAALGPFVWTPARAQKEFQELLQRTEG